MSYTHTSFTAAGTLLATRLGDSAGIHFTSTERQLAIVEAVRMWNTLTAGERARGTFATSDGNAFYQLPSVLSDGATLLRSHTIKDRSVVIEMAYHLMENPALTGWTDHFTTSQLQTALQRRRDQFLLDTASVVSTRSDAVTGSSDGRVTMADTVIGIRRAVWRVTGGKRNTLRVGSERTAVTMQSAWRTHGTPRSYSVSALPNLSVQLVPPPSASGYLDTVVVTTGATLDISAGGGTGTLLGIPDDYVWGVKYGAMADVLRDLNGPDPSRAEWCEQMYNVAVQLAQSMPVVLYAEIDGVAVQPSSLAQTDMSRDGWEGLLRGTPTVLSLAGPDCVVLTRVPDSATHTVLLEVVRRADVAGTYIQVGREHLDAILSMAQFICLFKHGGQDFDQAQPLMQKFMDAATQYSLHRSAASTALQVMRRSSAREAQSNPWLHEPRTVEDNDDEVRLERNARRRPFRKA